jgi:hypothetical protein
MRIGSLQNLSFQKYEMSSSRDVIQKHVPGYLQVQNYDLVSHEDTITVSGTLVGSSNANLSTQIEQLRAMHRQKRVIWIDASDQYQDELSLARITQLTGPTIDSSVSPLIAKFSLQAESLPPWGTTHANPFNQSGILFRDLDGRLLGNAVNPLSDNCNFTGSPAGGPFTSFSWEFIVDNQNPFTNVTSVQESNAKTGTYVNGPILGGYAGFSSLAIDNSTSFQANGEGALEGTLTSPAASKAPGYDFAFDLGASGVPVGSFDRIRMWFKTDQTSNLTYYLKIKDLNGNTKYWVFSPTANVAMNLLANFNVATGGTFNSNIRYIGIDVDTGTTPPSSVHVWIDDPRFEVGYVNHCEDTSGWALNLGSSPTFSVDSTVFKNSYYGIGAAQLPSSAVAETSELSALKMNGTSDTAGNLMSEYSLPLGGWNLTPYDFLCLWVRADFGGNATGTINVYLLTDGADYWIWGYPNMKANQWYRIVAPLRNPSLTNGTPNLSSISAFGLQTANGAVSASTNIWHDEIALDVGLDEFLEMQVPDNISELSNGGNYTMQAYTWNGSSYANFLADWPYPSRGFGYYFSLDGSSSQQVFSSASENTGVPINNFPVNTIGQQVSSISSQFLPTTKNYTTTYGCMSRWMFNLRIAPASSDSLAGNYPSDDLSGFMAINKVRLKVQVYIANEDTSVTGF